MAILSFSSVMRILQCLGWSGLALVLAVILPSSYIVYNLFFHPLSSVPGPKSWAATQIPYTIAWLRGGLPILIHELHEKHGDVVRVAPNRLSFTHPDAWHAIRGHRKSGQGEHGKDTDFYFLAKHNILGASRADHTRFRRILSHGFSAKSMQDQQPLIMRYVDLMMQRLREKTHGVDGKSRPAVENLAAWFNFTTFDVIGDLAFGEPFGCLEESRYHPWVETIFQTIRQAGFMLAIQWYCSGLLEFFKTLTSRQYVGGSAFDTEMEYAHSRIKRRLALETIRPDFVEAMATAKSDDGRTLTMAEMTSNARILVVAGSETTATALSAAAYFLARHPEVQARLADEVRTNFATDDEINFFSVNKLDYMLAVLDESMRMFPPVPSQLPRICQPGGDILCGFQVPGGTRLEIWPLAMNYSSKNFTAPDLFIPERWLDESKHTPGKQFDKQRHAAFQPFSVGPRNCIGKNLAYVEMRVILARLIWNYDLALADAASENFLRCKSYALWLKGPLNVRLSPVRG